jgi:hypothetical protein
MGYPCRSLHTQGGGVQDFLVGVPDLHGMTKHAWVLVECKVARNKRGAVTESQFTDKQREWYSLTSGFPRLVVTSAQDAVEQLRRMVG